MQIQDFIKKYDTQNQFNVLKESYKQVADAWNNKIDLSHLKTEKFSSILFCGLGGSAISGDLFCDYLSGELKIPFNVVRGYNLPAFADETTLIIISSYSGNTEESISCFEQALRKNSKIVIITSGGKIGDMSASNKIPVVKIQSGLQPRYALGLSFFSLLKIIQELGIASEENNVKKILELWQKRGEEYSSDNNQAVQIANEIIGFIPIIYSSEFFASTGYRLKCQLNENSKLHAFHNSLPEMNHNEIIGWESYKEKQFHTKVICLTDKEYHPQNKKRFDILREILAEQKIEVLTLSSNEENKKVRIMDLIFLSDWISFYASVLRGFDPSEIDFIHRMKQRLT
ncbi:MAG: bifunctional phosphoglucose/phosphomannose isomerase [Ignavibacteriaceae bacterium]|nr:bifunctional phosphoglucose/phosphomannose isomerase [Ignavibacteriaceae bacterium]